MVTWPEGQVTGRKTMAEQAKSSQGAPDEARARFQDVDIRTHTSGESQPHCRGILSTKRSMKEGAKMGVGDGNEKAELQSSDEAGILSSTYKTSVTVLELDA
ncbi:unnamed protein product [Caretta caretta]